MRIGVSFSRWTVCWLALFVFALLPACRHTPSYNDIKVEKDGTVANSNSGPTGGPAGAGASTGPGNSLAPMPASSAEQEPNSSLLPVPDSSQSSGDPAVAAATPSYFDQKTGQIRNLPLFPGAKVRKVQYGPINGTPQVTLAALSTAPFDKITAFYDKVVKDNGWTIDDSGRGENSWTWQLSRGQTDRAAIRVDKEPLGRVSISLARTN